MNNFGSFITPQEAKEWGDKNHNPHTLKYWQALARRKPKKCQNCDENEWLYVDLGLCFSCVTGESDASDDTELIP